MNQSHSKVQIIAEMACSHEGDQDLAQTIIDGAGRGGADAIQFQIFVLRERWVPQHPDMEKVGHLELSKTQWEDLTAYSRARYPRMKIIACVYENDSVDLSECIDVDAYKIHTCDLSNPRLIKYVAQTGKRIDLSVGASTIDEIQRALDWIRATSRAGIWLMYGLQNFPTPIDAVHLHYLMKLRQLFELPVCYQDHTDAGTEAAFWLPAAAVGMGVDVLEKHITHDRSRKGIDHEAALNPDEFGRFVEMVRIIEEAKGSSVPRPFSDAERTYRNYAQKSIVAARDLLCGTRLTDKDIAFMFAAAPGLLPIYSDRLVGRTVKRDIRIFDLIRKEDVV